MWVKFIKNVLVDLKNGSFEKDWNGLLIEKTEKQLIKQSELIEVDSFDKIKELLIEYDDFEILEQFKKK